MFERNKSNEINFQNCLKVALAVMKSKIISNEKSSIGLIFFGTVCLTLFISINYCFFLSPSFTQSPGNKVSELV